MPLREVGSYADALRVWKTPEDIAVWIAAHFTYDVPRAMTLSENRKGGDERPPIHAPHELFALRTGMCVDLARFGVETLRIIDPSTDPRYLMVEFQPMWIQGNILRLHWMAMFRRKGNAFFFADTKRPGHIAGPYGGTKAFIPEYERFRERTVVSFREWASYEKQRKTRAVKRRASEGRMRTPETRRPVAE